MFGFTNRAGTRVTCPVERAESFQDQFSAPDLSALDVGTFLSGPTDCTGFLNVFVEYRSADGEPEFASVSADGRSVSGFFQGAASPVQTFHSVFLPACDCRHDYR